MSRLFSSLIIRFIRTELELRVLADTIRTKEDEITYHYSHLGLYVFSLIIPYLKPNMTILEWSFGHSHTVR